MKKKIAIILVLAMIAGCLAACGKQASEPGTDGDGKEIKIGALYPTQSISFCQEIRRGVEEAAAEFSFKTVECVYDLDADKGVEMMRNLIVQQVDAIVLHSVYSDAFAAPTQEAMDAGIPVITVDGMVNTEVTTFVASDNTQGGTLAGEFVGKYLEGKGNVLIITSEPGNVTMVERNDGFHAGLAGYPDIKITEVMDDGLSGMEGYANTVENALNANPDYDFIITNYSDCTYGVLSILEMYPDKYGNIKVSGYDADDDMLEMIKSGTSPLVCTVAQNPYLIGHMGVESVKTVLDGGEVPVEQGADVILVTAENADSYAS